MINSSNSNQTSGFNEQLSLDETIFVKKIDALYKSLMNSAIANIVIAFTLVLILWEVIDHKILAIWFAAISLINVVRITSYFKYSKIEKNLKQYEFWGKIFFGLMLATAMAWACVSLWLLPENDSIYHYLPILVLVGVSAGAITSLGYHIWYMFAYFNILLLPIFFIEAAQSIYLSNLIAALILLFIFVALINGKRFYDTFIENIKLHYNLEKNQQEILESKNVAVAANSAKSSFVSMISHELRTPLNAIMGFGQLLKMSENPKLNDEQFENTQGILDSGKHLLSLIEELLDLSKIESHKLNLSIESVSLGDVLGESISILSPVALEHNIELKNNVENIYLVQADTKRLKQVFINLISNAIKYNNVNGSVTIEVNKKENTFIKVSVIDTGYGLREEQISKLFQPFQRYDEKKEGIGLGLYITQNLVELMDGKIGVESEQGKGSIFWFELPLSD